MNGRFGGRPRGQSSKGSSSTAKTDEQASGQPLTCAGERDKISRHLLENTLTDARLADHWSGLAPVRLTALAASQRNAILGVAMVVAGIFGDWSILFVPHAISWIIVAGLVEIIGWVVLVDFWLRGRD